MDKDAAYWKAFWHHAKRENWKTYHRSVGAARERSRLEYIQACRELGETPVELKKLDDLEEENRKGEGECLFV